ncbi:zinc-dependent metalloprotease [Nocardioides sp. NBC_00368]|uniref:zinc-dependent metalloprotease n=1 Tax=Nocardioides sp. NBC_00368 TaxID=2976000 RepID=UPI002E20E936
MTHRAEEPRPTGATMVDWDLAVRLGAKVAGDGPIVSRDEARQAVEELRADAAKATEFVREFTGLDAPRDTAPVLVVDRRGWIQANADTFAHVISPVVDRITAKRAPGALSLAVGSKVSAAEVGGLLGFMSSKILGQFDPFFGPSGRLLLVAPNAVHVERELGLDPTDFRLWVCLHEETHRVQFTASPWMRDHLFAQIEGLSEAMDPASIFDGGLQRVTEALKGNGSIVDAFAKPEQKEIIDRVTGMMSLLEGHADVVMDDVGPGVIPSVTAIRKAFNKRRQGIGMLDRLLRRLLGLEAKMAQYRDGAKFVRHVVDRVGMDEFNAVFAGPENLPSKAEIVEPDAWVARVL